MILHPKILPQTLPQVEVEGGRTAPRPPLQVTKPEPPAPATPKRTRFGDQTRCRPRLLRPSGSVLITKPDAARACYAQMELKMAQDGLKMPQDGAKIAQDGLEMAQHGAKMAPR